MIKEYWHFIKDYLKISQTKLSYFIEMIITAISYKSFLLLKTLFAAWIVKYVTNGDWKWAYISLGLLAGSYALYRLFYFINCKIYGKNMNYCYQGLQTRILDKLVSVDDNFTNCISKGKLVNSINTDVLDIGDMCDQISELLTTILQVGAIWIIVAFFDIKISIIFLLYCLLYIILSNYADRKSASYLKKEKHEVDHYSSLFSQVLSGLQEIKTFDMLPKIKKHLAKIQKRYNYNYSKERDYITLRDNDVRCITHIVKIIIYVYILLLMINGQMTVDVLVLIIGYFETTTDYLTKLISSTQEIRKVNISVERVNSILNYKVTDNIVFGDTVIDDIDGVIEFKDVYFKNNLKNVLQGISFTIKANTITAIVGQSGAGKTSIINLLLRLYKPNKGEILIDGINIFDYSKDTYKSNVSVVNQKPFIFNMSIRKNLNFVDTNIDNQIKACKKVGIHDFIVSLPQGYNTVLRENANNISGGQKQLISLARTLLSKAEILLFDEITSSLDPDTASHINDILKELKKDHTIVMITHKPELMKKADRILVLHDGKIVGDGTHQELLENNEHYRWLQARKSASSLGVFDND